eukprot:scaffold63298_cov60-Phaeocystis_antarctica.AAC.3
MSAWEVTPTPQRSQWRLKPATSSAGAAGVVPSRARFADAAATACRSFRSKDLCKSALSISASLSSSAS